MDECNDKLPGRRKQVRRVRADGKRHHNSRFTIVEEEQIRVEYEAGKTIYDLAAERGCCPEAIGNAVKAAGGTMRPNGQNQVHGRGPRTRKFTAEVERQILAEYQAGATTTELAEKYGCSDVCISWAIRHVGGELRIGGPERLFDGQEDERNADEYMEGATLDELCRKYGGSVSGMSTSVQRGGGIIRDPSETSRTYPDEIESEIVVEFESGVPTPDLAAKYHMSIHGIRGVLHRWGVATPRRKYTLRHDVFASPETNPLAAYFLGWMLTDGCVFKPERGQMVIMLSIHGQDGDILEAFREFIGSDRPIYEQRSVRDNGYKQCMMTLCFRSDQMANDLARYGVVPRKTYTAYVHPAMQDSADFWRGAVDGDGSLWIGRQREDDPRPVVSMTGTEAVCRSFLDMALTVGSHNANPRSNKNSRAWSASVNCSCAVLVAQHLYSNPVMALKRKLLLAQEFVAIGRRKRWLSK